MPKYKVIYQSKEHIHGVEPRTRDWADYDCVLTVRDGGKMPVLLEMVFVPPHPFSVDMPLEHKIRAESITALYSKVIRFLSKYGVRFCG